MSIGTYFLIAIIVLLLAVLVFHVVKTYREKGKEAAIAEMREVAYQLFLKAEKLYGRDTGKSKMEWVIGQFYRLIAPGWLSKFLSETTVTDYLQSMYDEYYVKFKDYLDDGQINGSVRAEGTCVQGSSETANSTMPGMPNPN